MSHPEQDESPTGPEMGAGHEAYSNLAGSEARVEVAQPADDAQIVRFLTTEKYPGYPEQRIFVVRGEGADVVGIAVAGIGRSRSDSDAHRTGHILDLRARGSAGESATQALEDACYTWIEEQGAVAQRPSTERVTIPSSEATVAALRHSDPIEDEELIRDSKTGRITFPDGTTIQSG